ncbi:hypothetical protein WH50_06770 [Pokkaliibacter plantistimulans]|uniref:Double zinc ribbon domain-containing protein n=2 Tax=Pokkaliibacter plantistimulans TaxID=1635171 RepID=A0ABX5M537_9GAMM|nr:hypothetical protein WH50_06770 [Pokkaliibacter plantistimulans]
MKNNKVYFRSFFNQLFYPCVLCRSHPRPPTGLLCTGCQQDMPFNQPACLGCSLPLEAQSATGLCGQCLKQAPLYNRVWSPWRYETPLPYLISRWKYQADFSAGRLLASLMLGAWQEAGLQPPEVLLPVPMHRQRLQQRGFNHSLWLAQYLSRHLQIKVDTHYLQRTQATATQQGLSARARRRNLRSAFALRGNPGYRHVAVIDDVMTTGATANAIAALLRSQQITRLQLWCLARTPHH